MSQFTVNEMIKLISDKIEAKFLHNLLTSNKFWVLTNQSPEKAVRSQVVVFVRYVICFHKKA